MEEEIRSIPTIAREAHTITIPLDLLKHFQQDVRVIIKFPGLIGIPIPDVLLNKELIASRESIREFEPMLVPRHTL